MSPSPAAAPPGFWSRFAAGATRLFHAYGSWLASISWLKFVLLAVLLLISAGVLSSLINIPVGFDGPERVVTVVREPPKPPRPPAARGARTPPAGSGTAQSDDASVQISIDKDGIRVVRRGDRGSGVGLPATGDAARSADAAASAVASAALSAASAATGIGAASAADGGAITIHLPERVAELPAVREALEEARTAVNEAVREAQEEVREEAIAAAEEAVTTRTRVSRRRARLGDGLPEFAFLWIVASAILKISYKGRIRAEAKAQVATETAESEQLKRQVVEARMAAMQAQVEPHFLFNTLASIDHLIESDPARASQMQKNLIALLRASMPAMREQHPAGHTLGREVDVVRPYIEILKVRMEDRLQATVDVPEGLRSADFPPMVIQSLVENAIKHGLEPKAEGGTLSVKAEIVDGRLAVRVADTGLGFGVAPTAGTGTGLANIRERLKLLHGERASLVVEANTPTGTAVTVSVPYRAGERDAARA